MSRRLPRGWVSTTIGELLGKLQYGLTTSATHDTEGPRFLRITDIHDGLINWDTVPSCELTTDDFEKYKLNDGDIVFARTGSIEKACMIRRPPAAVFASYLIRGKPPLREISHWLHYFVNSHAYRKQAWALSAGIGRANLNARNLSTITLLLPPLPEQRRIVEAIESYLSRLDAAIAALERVKKNLERYRKSVLKAAVEGRLVPTEAELARKEGRDYEPASVLLERILKERRKRWEEAEWKKIVEKAKQKAAKERRKKAGKPLKRGEKLTPEEWQNIPEKEYRRFLPRNDKWKEKYKEPAPPNTDGLPELPEGWCWASPGQFFAWSSGSFLPQKSHEKGDVPVYGGNGITGYHNVALINTPTLVIGRVGAHCGNVHLTTGPAWITDNAIYAVYCPPSVHLGYWRMVMSLKNLNANAGGTGQPYVNQRHLNELVVPLPPLSEQIRIVEEVEKLLSVEDSVTNEVATQEHRAHRLRQSILKWAFEGKLVDQDPSDLPAPRPGKWFVYALECDDGSIYIGQTENVEERWKLHASGRGAEWTRRHPPVKLIHWKEFDSLEDAVKREKELKTGFGLKWLKREYAAGRTRQAGEPASILLERIRAERELMTCASNNPRKKHKEP